MSEASLTGLTYPAVWKLLGVYGRARAAGNVGIREPAVSNTRTCCLCVQSLGLCANSLLPPHLARGLSATATHPSRENTLGRGLSDSLCDGNMRLGGGGAGLSKRRG